MTPEYGAYIVMEHLEGRPLNVELRARKRLPLDQALRWMRQVCSAVAVAHAAGVIHRDLKPHNIFLEATQEGPFVKVLDFGLAKLQRVSGESIGALTKSGTLRIDRRAEVGLHDSGGSSGAAARLAAGAAQLVAAVAALHDAGRVHCDLKPSNILITTTGRLVVLDFGLSAPLLGQLARPGFSGTLSYAAPEQLWGGALTVATDWYSVGVVLFEALTGELPAGEVAVGEVVWSIDVATGQRVAATVVQVRRATRECLALRWQGGSLVCTPDHPLYSPEAGAYRPASDWVTGPARTLLIAAEDGVRVVAVEGRETFAGVHEVIDVAPSAA